MREDKKSQVTETIAKLSRRGFLKGLSFLGAISVLPKQLWASTSAVFPSHHGKISKGEVFGALVDLTRCIGCRACSRACVNVNNLHPDDDGSNVSLQHREIPTFDKWSVVNPVHGVKTDGSSFSTNIKKQCMHCLEPACVSVCPVGALAQTEKGPVIYRTERCIGCRYCMIACPFEVPKFDWNSGIFPVIGKCQFCAQNRLYKGLQPGCVEACPTGALKFGKRQTLLFEAKSRIKANPGKYIPHVYGENEIGGTSWLYISSVPFESLGFKTKLPSSPIPSFTWEVVSRLPLVVAALAGIFGTVAASLAKEKSETPEKSHKDPS